MQSFFFSFFDQKITSSTVKLVEKSNYLHPSRNWIIFISTAVTNSLIFGIVLNNIKWTLRCGYNVHFWFFFSERCNFWWNFNLENVNHIKCSWSISEINQFLILSLTWNSFRIQKKCSNPIYFRKLCDEHTTTTTTGIKTHGQKTRWEHFFPVWVIHLCLL